MSDPTIKKYMIKLVAKEVSREVRHMAADDANSIFQSKDPDQLKSFTWEAVILSELSRFAPVLQKILIAVTRTRVSRPNTHAEIGMCVAVILKHHNPKLNLVQKVNSLILSAGHTSKQVMVLHTLQIVKYTLKFKLINLVLKLKSTMFVNLYIRMRF